MSWVQCRPQWPGFDSGLLLIAIGLQSLSMKICMLQSPFCPRETGSPGRLSGDWLSIFFLDGLGSIPALPNSFYLFPVVEKDFLFLFPFCPRETSSPIRIFFGSLRGSNAGADKTIYQIFELAIFLSLVSLNVLRFKCRYLQALGSMPGSC